MYCKNCKLFYPESVVQHKICTRLWSHILLLNSIVCLRIPTIIHSFPDFLPNFVSVSSSHSDSTCQLLAKNDCDCIVIWFNPASITLLLFIAPHQTSVVFHNTNNPCITIGRGEVKGNLKLLGLWLMLFTFTVVLKSKWLLELFVKIYFHCRHRYQYITYIIGSFCNQWYISKLYVHITLLYNLVSIEHHLYL